MTFTDEDIAILKSSLAAHGQEHLLAHWEDLSSDQKDDLYRDIQSIDFTDHLKSFKRCMQKELSAPGKEDYLKPLPPDACESVFISNKINEKWTNRGLKEISEGKVALLLMAGGQGTRLGVPYPKGMYNVGLQSSKCLYQLQAERVRKQEQLAAEMYGSSKAIRWYIMTSEHTKKATVDYFKSNGWFGLSEENIIFFEQEMIPCLSLDGKVIMDSKFSIARAPGGNGDLYRSMGNEGVLQDMLKKGVRSVHCYCVDNILNKVPDPLFIGCCLDRQSDCGAKVVSKAYPTEAVGVICECNGTWKVVEYSEISKETANMVDSEGKLLFSQGNICNHYFTTSFLTKVIEGKESQLIHHVARKKIPTINSSGERVLPTEINGIKMEKFVFDVFQFSEKFTVLEVARNEEFSPLKNPPGAPKCSPQTCLEDLSNQHKRWIIRAGGTFKNEGLCEISPLVSCTGENLEDLVKDKFFSLPLHLEVTHKNGYHNGHTGTNGLHSKL
ncbi:UDP-N-acetylhexosamine pyrophosphorylase-like protein 1 [Bolinopsis microptera]|uniref:UDP-N-acetylhexosamine pyrophosphorylase-like protein 1 n=1 Tax=Bolinopsis microptera TaxID=2820187 RepID=UPI003078D30D